jgi:hypothetical protein
MSTAVKDARDFLASLGYLAPQFGAYRTYEFQGPQVAAVGGGASFVDSPPVNVRFRRDVIALGIIGQVIRGVDGAGTLAADDLAYAQTEMRLQFGSNEDAFDNGYGSGLTAPFLMLFGRFNKPMYAWQKPRIAKAGIIYTATFRNTSTTQAIKPTAAVLCIELESIGPRTNAQNGVQLSP